MIVGRQFVLPAIALLLMAGTACNKKKPHLPAQATAPAEPIPSPLPTEISEQTPPPPQPAPKEETQAKAEEPKQQTTKRRKPRKPPQPATTAQSNPPGTPAAASPNATVALARPPANPASEPPPDTAISADVSSAQLSQQKQTTAQLLDSTEKTIGGLPHNLPADQEQMVVQIRAYMAQSRKATTDGDFERAYNLATKAHLLSDALVKK